jgi:hypothetical protein
VIPAVPLIGESFHRSWALWLQAPIVLAVVIATAGAISRTVRQVAWSRAAVAVAVAAPLAVAVLLPQAEYHFSGHEGAYGELLDGDLPETGDLSGHRTFAVPAGVAWALGRVAPGEAVRSLWLASNRASLALLLLALGLSAALLAGEDPAAQRRAMAFATVGVLACPPLLGWSATAFFIVPALAMGAAALALGLAGHPAAALAWGSLALASRMETAPLLLAGALAVGATRWRALPAQRRGSAALAGALGVLAWQAFGLSQKRSELPLEDVGPDPSVILENLSLIPLGGPWLNLGLLAALAALAAVAGGAATAEVRRGERAVAVAAAVALVQPSLLVDVGARHLLPAVVLVVVLAAGAGARAVGREAPRRAVAVAGAVLVSVALAVPAARDTQDLSRRYMRGEASFLPAWIELADRGPTGAAAELLRDECYLVVPGGPDAWRGTRSSQDVREVHRAALARDAGWCVQWAVGGNAEFSGDTRSERLDRAIRVLDLVPVGWVDPAPGPEARWMLFEPR